MPWLAYSAVPRLLAGGDSIRLTTTTPWSRDLHADGLLAALAFLLPVAYSAPASAVDTLVYRSPTGSVVKRQAEIIDLHGDQVLFRGPTGLEEAIPRARLIRFETTWTEAYVQGQAALAGRDYEQAVALFRQAKTREARPWAQREAAAGVVQAALNRGDWLTAGEEFLPLAQADPNTRHWAVAPLAWRSIGEAPAALGRAGQWLRNERLPAYRLLGASWLLAGPERDAAIAVLEKLTLGPDQRVGLLAQVQLWRTKLPSSQVSDADRWRTVVEQLPPESRGLGWFLVGEAYARAGAGEPATLAYLHIPILRPEVSPLSADALLAAGAQLEKMMRHAEAHTLYREILDQHPASPAASLAKTRLAAPTP